MPQHGERIRPNVTVRRESPNQSARTSSISLIVIHDTESHNRPGSSDLEAIGSLFANPSFDASAHVCTDGDGNSARYVHDDRKAWACVAYNSASLNIEQIGVATGGEYTEAEIKETARWVARWSHIHGVPIRKARTALGRVLVAGVTTHKKLHAAGGGHSDPGPRYPMRRMLRYAKHYKRSLEAST